MQFRKFEVPSLEYAAACQLRNDMLRLPIGMDLFSEDLSQERHALHFGMFEEKRLLATVMIVPQAEAKVVLRQMCVAAEFQRRGIGSTLLENVERELHDSGIQLISLAARVDAISFYENLGYVRISEEFLSVGIPHVRMEKNFSP